MNLKPLGNKIIVQQLEAVEQTKSGIILPESAKEKPQEGKVMAVGDGKYVDGKKVALSVKVGDKVLYKKYGPDEVKVDDKEYLILSEDDILAIIK